MSTSSPSVWAAGEARRIIGPCPLAIEACVLDGFHATCKVCTVALNLAWAIDEAEALTRVDRDKEWAHALKTAVEEHFPVPGREWRQWPAVPDVVVVCEWLTALLGEHEKTVVGEYAKVRLLSRPRTQGPPAARTKRGT